MGTGVIPLKRAPAIASGAGVGYRSRQPGRDAPRRGPREAAAADRLAEELVLGLGVNAVCAHARRLRPRARAPGCGALFRGHTSGRHIVCVGAAASLREKARPARSREPSRAARGRPVTGIDVKAAHRHAPSINRAPNSQSDTIISARQET